MLARKEAELSGTGVRFINVELQKIFTSRSLEAIKKARQKPEYRRLVESLIAEEDTRAEEQPMREEAEIEMENETNSTFLDYARTLPPTRTIDAIENILRRAEEMGPNNTIAAIGLYLREKFPQQHQRRRRPRSNPAPTRMNRRTRRRQEYRVVQTNWTKHQGRCIKSILEGPSSAELPPENITVPFWKAVFEQYSEATPDIHTTNHQLDMAWLPITIEEMKMCKPSASTSPGPDGVTAKAWNSIPLTIRTKIFNILLWCKKLPEHLYESRTTLIPKTNSANSPGDFRPIAVSSVIVRHLHAILARRIMNGVDLDPRQQAFIDADGCATNITLFDLLLRHQHLSYNSCSIASLDVAKAFDSVSHKTIIRILESYGAPQGLREYIKVLYATSSTRIKGKGWISDSIRPKAGVKQGDPLSPILFNLVIDRLLKSLPSEISARIGETKINALAFADDLILCSTTEIGLQQLLDHTAKFLSSCGMRVNPAKCKTISIKGQAKQKNTVIRTTEFNIEGVTISALKRSDKLKYLGLEFSPDGKCGVNIKEELLEKLHRVAGAPLKPQQRMHILRTVLLPQLYHKLTLGNTHIGLLNKIDQLTRGAIRKWLDLPQDVTKGYFHAAPEDGGLGIPSMRYSAPLMRYNRLTKIVLPNLETTSAANFYLAREIDRAARRLETSEGMCRTSDELNRFWARKLHSSVDGAGLKDSKGVKESHRWIREPTKLLSGRDYIHCVKTRINALPTRSRTARGRPNIDRVCRAGCPRQETLNHVAQQCHRTHAIRIDRHNCVVNFIKHATTSRQITTITEPHIQTEEGLRKPDLVLKDGRKAVIIDAQVITDSFSLEMAHLNKKRKYNTPRIVDEIKQRLDVDEVEVTSVTLNWRGVWSRSSYLELQRLNLIKKKDAALISTRVLIGTYASFCRFNSSTLTYREPG